MFKKIRKFGLPIVAGTALALVVPTLSFARDRDDERREFREHERHEFRERSRPRFRVFVGPSYNYNPYYNGGYYDAWGNWHPYRSGFYDRWGIWHPYY